jgi:hypothetical protein
VRSGTGRAAAAGALFGLFCVVAVVALVALGVLPNSRAPKTAAGGPVLVAVVLPDANGVLALRVLDRYERDGGLLRIAAVDPLASATVPGTSATTLAEAYSFGGGDRLAAAYADSTGALPPAWIVVGPESWRGLMASRRLDLRLATGIDVFDGKQLYSYPAGSTFVPASEISKLMDGATYLSDSERKTIRSAVGDALAVELLRRYSTPDSGIATNLTPEQLGAALGGLQSPPIRADISR